MKLRNMFALICAVAFTVSGNQTSSAPQAAHIETLKVGGGVPFEPIEQERTDAARNATASNPCNAAHSTLLRQHSAFLFYERARRQTVRASGGVRSSEEAVKAELDAYEHLDTDTQSGVTDCSASTSKTEVKKLVARLRDLIQAYTASGKTYLERRLAAERNGTPHSECDELYDLVQSQQRKHLNYLTSKVAVLTHRNVSSDDRAMLEGRLVADHSSFVAARNAVQEKWSACRSSKKVDSAVLDISAVAEQINLLGIGYFELKK